MKPEPFRLANGLTLLTAVRRDVPVVSVWTFYAVGSRDEAPGETGLAHFLEHMMFKGTRRFARGELDERTQRCGGTNNAYTTCDSTAYFFDLPAAHLDLALRVEADRMRNLRFDQADFAVEKEIVLSEIRSMLDQPEHRLLVEADRLTFPDHGYGHPVLGWEEDVAGLELDRLRSFYDEHYRPERCVLVVVGDIDEAAVRRRVEQLFGGLEPSGRPAAREGAPARATGAHRHLLREEVVIPRLYVQFPGIDAVDPREPAFDVLAHMLAPHRNARLPRRLVQQEGLVSAVRAENDSRAEPGVVWIELEGVSGADPRRIESALFEELERLAETGPAPAELERTRRALRAEELFRRECAADIAEDLGDAAVISSFEALELYLERLGRVQAADVAAACDGFLRRDRATAVWSVPR